MSVLAPAEVVQPYPAAPPTVGLIASARLPQDPPGTRWQGGFRYLPENCQGGNAIAGCDNSTSKTIATDIGIVGFQPVILWAGDKCSPQDRTHDYKGRARRLLEADQSRQLAKEFWRGDLAKANPDWPNRFLADNTHVNVLNVGTLSPVDALACLEDGLASCSGQRGMIHCTVGTAIHWANARLIERVGQYVMTINNTIVVADLGYDGSGPHGQARQVGHVWAYGTDLVDVRLDDVQVLPDLELQALERTQNTFQYRAERLGAATWAGCCHVGVEIDLFTCSHTGGS